MAEQNNENTQTKIEEVIREKLTGDAQKNAMDFVAFLRANELTLTANSDGQGWAVGGTVGNSIGYMWITGTEQFPGPWTFWFNSCDFGGNSADDELKKITWAHASPCGHCHPGWKDCGGGNRTMFGREFENLCHSPLMFANPDAETVENMNKLMLMLT